MDCLFCQIVDNKLPSRKIYEDEHNVALLDINPATPGHALIIPRKHSETIFDIDSIELRRTIEIVKMVAEKAKKELKTDNVNIIQNNGKYAGQIVNHLHFHVVPRFPNDNIDFKIPRYQMSELQFYQIQEKLNINAKLPEPPKEPATDGQPDAKQPKGKGKK